MDRLWTPWRFEYLRNADQAPGCVFCRALQEARDAENFLLYRGMHAFVLLNLFPYTSVSRTATLRL
jgi:ATP adenylyltransferase